MCVCLPVCLSARLSVCLPARLRACVYASVCGRVSTYPERAIRAERMRVRLCRCRRVLVWIQSGIRAGQRAEERRAEGPHGVGEDELHGAVWRKYHRAVWRKARW